MTPSIHPPVIPAFEGVHRFLSSFWYPAPVYLDGEIYPTTEHGFHAAKFLDPARRRAIQAIPGDQPGRAKRLGRLPGIRPDWDQVRVDVMRGLLLQKFAPTTDLGRRLRETAPSYLIEGNTWHDNFWGNCTCHRCSGMVGTNMLGRLLMEIRDGEYAR